MVVVVEEVEDEDEEEEEGLFKTNAVEVAMLSRLQMCLLPPPPPPPPPPPSSQGFVARPVARGLKFFFKKRPVARGLAHGGGFSMWQKRPI